MASTKRNVTSQNNVSLTIRLDDLFEKDDEIHENRAIRESFAQAVIDRIVENSKEGKGTRGQKLRSPYSDSYADSLKFKAFGKSKRDINMTLTGSMLDSLSLRGESKNVVKIGWRPGSTDGKKAHGHITGQKGANPKMKRDFFGLPEKQLRQIADEFKGRTVRGGGRRRLADLLALAEAFDE